MAFQFMFMDILPIYFLLQTPLPATAGDFPLLALQGRCSCIVDLDLEHTKSKVSEEKNMLLETVHTWFKTCY